MTLNCKETLTNNECDYTSTVSLQYAVVKKQRNKFSLSVFLFRIEKRKSSKHLKRD